MTTARLAANTFEKRVLKQVNKRRDGKGLRKVSGGSCLDGFAEGWAQQIATTGVMEHQSMAVILAGCNLTWAGEALARGTGIGPGKTVKMWMKSPPHRKVILKPRANRVGIGVRYDSEDRTVVVLDAGDVN